jgi:hypothetical protein
LLRQTTKDDLKHFTWKNVHDELKQRTLDFLRFIEAAVQNPSQKRNVQKKMKPLFLPCVMLHASSYPFLMRECVLSGLSKALSLRKVVLQKWGSNDCLLHMFACMGYNCTNNIFERFGKDFDCDLLKWKKQVEEDVKKEKELLSVVSTLGGIASNEELECENGKLQQHRQSMHPGYSLIGDNVMIVKPRHMIKQHRDKDHHMFQYVAYENRVSPNHMPDDITVADINKVPFTSFLPSGDEQLSLIDQFTVLVCQKWAKCIPSMGWFKDCMPSYILHKHMDDMKKKTSKV